MCAQAERGDMLSPLVASQPERLTAEGEARPAAGLAEAIRQACDPQAREQLLREYLLASVTRVCRWPHGRSQQLSTAMARPADGARTRTACARLA
jgi:hypothetical protein